MNATFATSSRSRSAREARALAPRRRTSLHRSGAALAAAAALTLGGVDRARADASAQVTITLNDTGQRLAQELGLDLSAFQDEVTTKVQDALQLSEVQRFLRSFADATSFSNRGLGVSYTAREREYQLGFAVNGAISVDLGDEGDDETPTVGVAPNLALMGGMSLSRWNLPELTVFANLFHYSTSSGALHGGITSLGLHAQLALVNPSGGRVRHLAQWGGVALTAGVELARWKLGLSDQIEHTIPLAGVDDTSSILQFAVGGRFDVGATTVTAPIELTTSVRLLHVARLYAGFGLDLSAGEATIGAGAFGALRGTHPGAPDMFETIGEISATAEGSHAPSALGHHLLLGAELAVWRLALFGQVSTQIPSALSVAAGLRVEL